MRKSVQIALIFSSVFSPAVFSANIAHASIEQLLINQAPIPTKRPDVGAQPSASETRAIRSQSTFSVSPISGSLTDGLNALSKRNTIRALQIRAGLKPGSLDRKILAWSIALSGQNDIPSSEIVAIASDLRDWPGQKAMIINAEKAFAKENPPANSVISAFSEGNPISIEGTMLLAKAHLARSQRKAARKVILPFWQNERLSEKLEQQILATFGSILTVKDHRHRMHQQFYNGRVKEGKRMGALAEQFSLAKAWAAVLQKSSNAKALINAVAPASRTDVAYQFIKIENARRTGNYRTAAKLLTNAPRDARSLIDPDEWWNERRIVSRDILELGDAKTAYRLASQHSATSPSSIADAEFHAGWYALRFLKDSTTARRHFQRLLDVTSQPISQSRGHYWMGRASNGASAESHYRKAASYPGTYYGQLASTKLGIKKLSISNPRPSDKERANFAAREQVRAIKKLEANGYAWRADSLYRHLAQRLTSPGELALLSARAERKGNNTLALQIGKLANARGLDVDTLAWPIGAIPASAKPGKTGLALSYAIARQESTFNVAARSPADARGLLQLLPGTAKAVARRKGLKYSKSRLTSDGGYNVTLGAAYLGEQLAEFNGSYILTFVGYNAGPRRSREWVARFGDPKRIKLNEVIDWVELIPFTETRNYVQRVMENYQVYKARLNNRNLAIVSDLTKGRR